MSDKIAESVINYLEIIAEKLSGAAAHLYLIYVKQAFAEGVATLIAFIFLWLCIVALAKWLYKCSNNFKNEVFSGFFGALMIATFVAVLPVTLGVGKEAVMKVLNPEYYAVSNIIKQLKGK